MKISLNFTLLRGVARLQKFPSRHRQHGARVMIDYIVEGWMLANVLVLTWLMLRMPNDRAQ